MKFELSQISAKPAPQQFPVLYESIKNGFQVLFMTETTGVVISNHNPGIYETGKLYDKFIPCTDDSRWSRLPAGTQLTLTQE